MIFEYNPDVDFLVGIYRRYYSVLLNLAKSYDQNEADDIVQMSFLRLAEHIDTLQSLNDKKLTVYLYITVRHVAINNLHQKSRQRKLKKKLQEDYIPDPSLEQNFLAKETAESVLSQMSLLDRDLLILRYYLQFNNDEIAKVMNMNPPNVRVYLSRARKRALGILKDWGLENA